MFVLWISRPPTYKRSGIEPDLQKTQFFYGAGTQTRIDYYDLLMSHQ